MISMYFHSATYPLNVSAHMIAAYLALAVAYLVVK